MLIAFVLLFQISAPAPADGVADQLASARRLLADESRPRDQRASLALDEAAAIDRLERRGAITGSPKSAVLLDEFNAANPKHSLTAPLALQAAVYVWAEGRRELDDWRLARKEGPAKTAVRERLDDAIRRLARLEPEVSGADPMVAQNILFRWAQAISDRAELDEPDSDEARARLRKALATVEPPPTDPSVAGYARLLRSDIFARLGDYEDAEKEVDEAARLKFPPPPEAMVEARVEAIVGRRRFREALRVIDDSTLDAVAKDSLGVRVRVKQGPRTVGGLERHEAEDDMFARAARIKDSPRPEARRALVALARGFAEPSDRAELESWEIVAEAALAAGQPRRASAFLIQGAERSRGRQRRDVAARMNLRAGAILFGEGAYLQAESLLAEVVDAPEAGPLRAKAGMLRVLALGRAVAAKSARVNRRDYVEALRRQVVEFPNDANAPEARWLLGNVELEDDRPDEARALWTSIPPTHRRWLDARLAVASCNQRELDELRLADDPAVVRGKFRDASTFLRQSLGQAPGDDQAMEIELASARLDLTPGVGRGELARSLCDRLAHRVSSPIQLSRARALRIVALAMTLRFAEAETEAAAEAKTAAPDQLLLAARLLDHAASDAASGSARARHGQLVRILCDALDRIDGRLSPADRAEAHLRAARAAIDRGELELARRLLRDANHWDPEALDPSLLRDLADAFLRLDAPAMAVDVERIRARKLKPGSAAWLDSRYSLALALSREGKTNDARKLIDAAAILHPDLGGGSLKTRFDRLRQRLEQE